MRSPTKQQAKGFDILVWVDGDGDIVTKSYTRAGMLTLKQMVPEYRQGMIAEIHCDPDEFRCEVPKEVSVGAFNPRENTVVPILGSRLH